jgi:hypothetical protein
MPPTYRVLREGAIDKRFSAQQVNGIWHFCPDDTAEIATALGLTLAADCVPEAA